jgi:1-acyl-sn-glycerol-3-phosphate acyltransferase
MATALEQVNPEKHVGVPTLAIRNLLVLVARFLSGASVRWVDSQPDRCQRVYFANHTSHLDAIVIWAALPSSIRILTRMVAAKDYWDGGWLRTYLSRDIFNALLIERKNIKVKSSPINMMLQEMGNHYSVIMFPEGGRTEGDTVSEFKSGLYYLSKKRPDLELIPVYLDNMNRILPRGEYLPVPMLSRVVFGPPMWLERGEPKNDFLDRARTAVLNLKNL